MEYTRQVLITRQAMSTSRRPQHQRRSSRGTCTRFTIVGGPRESLSGKYSRAAREFLAANPRAGVDRTLALSSAGVPRANANGTATDTSHRNSNKRPECVQPAVGPSQMSCLSVHPPWLVFITMPACHFLSCASTTAAGIPCGPTDISNQMHTLALTIFTIPSTWVEPFAWATERRGAVPICPSLATFTIRCTTLRTLFTLMQLHVSFGETEIPS